MEVNQFLEARKERAQARSCEDLVPNPHLLPSAVPGETADPPVAPLRGAWPGGGEVHC